jgi:release factor glutamine methyltransferase
MTSPPPGRSSGPAPTSARAPNGDAAAERSWTVLELLRWTTDHFAAKGIDSPRLDAECLLAAALETDRLKLYLDFEKPVSPEERARFRALVVRRANERVPVSLLLGEKEFWSLTLAVTRDVLTPRPDTETLVEAALARLPDPEGTQRILDIGTGSGAIALALARERPQAQITATDISPAALQIARLNADQLHIGESIRFLEGGLYAPVQGERFDLIVSNPPYLARASATGLPPELAHEPEQALFGGADGYEVLKPLIAGAGEALLPGGSLIVEVGDGQAETVAGLFAEAGLIEVETLRDLGGHQRVVAGRDRGGAK